MRLRMVAWTAFLSASPSTSAPLLLRENVALLVEAGDLGAVGRTSKPLVPTADPSALMPSPPGTKVLTSLPSASKPSGVIHGGEQLAEVVLGALDNVEDGALAGTAVGAEHAGDADAWALAIASLRRPWRG